jgi:hypothetical protein
MSQDFSPMVDEIAYRSTVETIQAIAHIAEKAIAKPVLTDFDREVVLPLGRVSNRAHYEQQIAGYLQDQGSSAPQVRTAGDLRKLEEAVAQATFLERLEWTHDRLTAFSKTFADITDGRSIPDVIEKAPSSAPGGDLLPVHFHAGLVGRLVNLTHSETGGTSYRKLFRLAELHPEARMFPGETIGNNIYAAFYRVNPETKRAAFVEVTEERLKGSQVRYGFGVDETESPVAAARILELERRMRSVRRETGLEDPRVQAFLQSDFRKLVAATAHSVDPAGRAPISFPMTRVDLSGDVMVDKSEAAGAQLLEAFPDAVRYCSSKTGKFLLSGKDAIEVLKHDAARAEPLPVNVFFDPRDLQMMIGGLSSVDTARLRLAAVEAMAEGRRLSLKMHRDAAVHVSTGQSRRRDDPFDLSR